MTCVRCGGLLVADYFADLWALTGPMEFQGVRCLNCGSIEDAVIRANRLQPPLPSRAQPSGVLGQVRPHELESGRVG